MVCVFVLVYRSMFVLVIEAVKVRSDKALSGVDADDEWPYKPQYGSFLPSVTQG